MRAFVPVLLLVLVPTVSGAADEAAEKDLKRLAGDWQVVAATHNGMTVKGDKMKGKVWRFEGTKLIPLDNRDDVATITLDPAKTPPALDIKDKGGKVVAGIYKFEGNDKLFVCGRLDGTRPKEFEAGEGSDALLFELERVKKK